MVDVPADRAGRERAKLERQHPFVKTMWEDMKKVPVIKPIAGAQPSAITRALKPFQLEGLDWMIKQEASQWKGGLLGDEMGMGKTIQAVSLLMSDFPAGLPSLVVVPPVALMQWQSEIKSYTNDRLRVLIHHNSSTKTKLLSQDDLARYDVIIISYSGLESLYRKQTKGWNRGSNLIKEDSPIHAIHYHRLILDEAHNIKFYPKNSADESMLTVSSVTHAESTASRQAAFDKLRLITDRIMLRRVKKDHTQSMELPPKK
ncbi:DNA repair protein rad16 [Ascosphaera aggregata]|nr:DNA repair protein rad16 [Ascosphaera aggregata]